MYNNQYHFYLEKRDDFTGLGPYLKYGKIGKNVSYCLDLTETTKSDGLNSRSFLLVKEPNSSTKFKIVTPHLTLYLKAETRDSREQWI